MTYSVSGGALNSTQCNAIMVVGLFLSVFMSSLRTTLFNLFCCCTKRRNIDTEVSSVSQPASSVSAAVRLASFHTAVTTIPTPDIQEPYQRRSSLSLYAKRCEMLKRYHPSSDSIEADCPSPTHQCSVMKETVFGR